MHALVAARPWSKMAVGHSELATLRMTLSTPQRPFHALASPSSPGLATVSRSNTVSVFDASCSLASQSAVGHRAWALSVYCQVLCVVVLASVVVLYVCVCVIVCCLLSRLSLYYVLWLCLVLS